MAATNGLVAGIYHMWIAFRDSSGYPMGQNTTPNSPSNGSTYHAFKCKHPVQYTPPTPTRELATRRGGQAWRGQRDLGISDLGLATIQTDSFDEQLHAYISGSSVDTSTMSGWHMTSQNAQNPDLPSFVLGLSIGFTTEDGSNEFLTAIYHNVQIRPRVPGASQSGGENPNPTEYEIVPNTSSRTGIGRLYSATSLSVTENNDVMMMIRYTSPIFVSTFIGNNSATTATFAYRPVSSDATGAATNSITSNGSTLAVTSVSTTTGVVTFASAPASAAKVVLALPTNYVAI